MWFPALDHRQLEPELMDQPLDRAAHEAALVGLRRVNSLSTSTRLIWRTLVELDRKRTAAEPLRVLDLGSGGGDVLIRLAKWARRAGRKMLFHGCDMSDSARQIATAAAQRGDVPHVEFFQTNVLADGVPGGYDVVMCSLFLHHFDDETALRLLMRMREAAGVAVLVDDLLRTKPGYALCWAGCRILTRSPVVHYDGPQSVRAAFTLDEARRLFERAGYSGATFRRHWPERFLMRWSRP
jgi:2-polyprenyl-3-methyl-5-hydroxy-6-metoxy-1,4-benzoquinol methylase